MLPFAAVSDRGVVEAVEALHASEHRIVLAVRGGGVAAVTDLLGVAGASRTVLEVSVPYAEAALSELVGGVPAQAVSVDTARAMATACLERARDLVRREGIDVPVAGVACTAAIASDRPKRGDHRAHIAVASVAGVATYSLTLDKGARDRAGEDRVVADVILRAVATWAGVEAPLPV